MKKIKQVLIVALVSLAFLKVADIIFYQVTSTTVYAEAMRKRIDRSIVVREYGSNQKRVFHAGNMLPTAGVEREIGRYVFNIDQNGFVETGNSVLPDPDLKILFLGGSTTETLYVAEQNRFPSIVERALRTDLGISANTYNGGMSGNNSMHSLAAFIAKGLPLRPDLAIMMHNINDMHVLARYSSYWQPQNDKALVVTHFEEATPRRAVLNTLRAFKNAIIPHLYGYLKPRLTSKYFSSGAGPSRPTLKELGIDRHDIEEQWRSSLTSFVTLARAWGITPVLMTQFNRYHMDDALFQLLHVDGPAADLDPEEFIDLYARFNDITREVAKAENVVLIDLEPQVPADAAHIYDTVHLTDEGSILVASLIIEQLKTLLTQQ